MRPLVLEIENLASFRGKQPPLDLGGLDLFAISGPTGSGKSSLLDAIVFALYGNIPRVGKGCTEMISLGTDRLSVRLDFRVRGRTLRVSRVLRRRKAADAQIEELVEGVPHPLADGVRRVDDEVERLIGLDLDAFTQCVILPQGEFQRFIKSKPGERREILRRLLRLTIYERMREKANKDASVLEAEIRLTQETLEKQLAGATPEAVAALERALVEQEAANTVSSAKLTAQERDLETLKARNRCTRELRQEREALAVLDRREPDIRRDEARGTAAARAAAVVPLLDASGRAIAKAQDAAHEAAQTRGALTRAQERHKAAEARLTESLNEANQLPALAQRLQQLDGAIALLQHLEDVRPRAREAAQGVQDQQEDCRGAQAKAAQTREAAVRLLAEVDRLRQSANEIAYDRERHQRLEALLPRASTVAVERTTLARTVDRARAAQDDSRRAAARAEQQKELVAASAAELAAAEEARANAQDAVDAARRHDMAAHLRRGLHTGAPCPVCEQQVSSLPPDLPSPALDRWESQLREAQAKERAASTSAKKAQAEATAAETAATGADRLAQDAAADEASGREHLDKSLAALVADGGGDLHLGPGESADARLQTELQSLTSAGEAHDAAIRRLSEAEARLAKAQVEVESEALRLELLTASLAQSRHIAEDVADAARSLEAQLAECGAADPKAERDTVAASQARIQKALDDAKAAESEAGRALSAATATAAQTDSAAREDKQTADAAFKAASDALQKAAFASPEDARRAYLEPDELRLLQESNQQYHRERHRHASRIAEVEKSLAGPEVEDDTVQQLADEVAKHCERHREGLDAAVRLTEQLHASRERLEQAEQLRAKARDVEHRHGLQKQLAKDLGGPEFQEYLLRQTFRDLVDGASRWLQTLTDRRYGLDLDETSFAIIDYDNAAERRSTDTLSGGETFLASLALALELGEQVRRAAGALDLDSLFIDEGFGTLDAETLETVASAVENLQMGGRMVGVITHLPELTARFPVQLHVSKGAGGARVETRRA